jgi:Sulfotransferase domain
VIATRTPELLDGRTGLNRLSFELRRHARWAREEGLAKLVEEDQLNFVERAPVALRKVVWRTTRGVECGLATPVFLFGVQRSGTNMVVRGLERSPQFEVHNENDRRLFLRYELKSMDKVREIVRTSRARFVLFKPLCDSHRADQLLDELGTTMPARAIWAYRDVESRVRSSLSKFRDHNLAVLADIAAGRALDRWQAQGIRPDTMELIRSFDWSRMTPASASALFWYVRNRLLLDLELADRPDVVVVRYRDLVKSPRESFEPVVNLLGLRWSDAFVAHIDRRESSTSRPKAPLTIDPRVRKICGELEERLDEVARRHRTRAVPVAPTQLSAA